MNPVWFFALACCGSSSPCSCGRCASPQHAPKPTRNERRNGGQTAATARILPREENDALMPATIQLRARPAIGRSRVELDAVATRGRLEAPDLELLLDAIGDREDRAGADERARLRRIRGRVELDLADRLTE